MRIIPITRPLLGTFAVTLCLGLGLQTSHAGRAAFEFFGNLGPGTGSAIEGEAVSDLTDDPQFPDSPGLGSGDSVAGFQLPFLNQGLQFPPSFSEEDNFGDNYGTSTEGFIYVPEAGQWKFFVRSDDASRLELNPNGPDPSGSEVIAEEPDCCNSFLDDEDRSSERLQLEPGTPYYFRMLHKEATGGDWFQVGWDGPGQPGPKLIEAQFVQEFATEGAPEITVAPESVTITERQSATFSVGVNGAQPLTYEWTVGGESVDAPNNPFITLEDVALEQDGTTVAVTVSNSEGEAEAEATLTVNQDTTAPTVVSVDPRGNPNGVTVQFSEAMSEESALNADNYAIDDGDIGIDSVEFLEGNDTVRVNTSGVGFAELSDHTIEISDLEDRAATANAIEPNPTTRDFSFGGGDVADYSTLITDAGAVRFWRLGETSGGTAASQVTGEDDQATANGSYSGVTLGAETLVRNATGNPAARFSEGANVDIPNGGDVNVGGPYQEKTIEFWIKPEEILGSDTAQGFWEQGGGTRGIGFYLIGNELFMNAWNNATEDGVGDDWGSGSSGEAVFVGGGNIQAGDVVHVVGVMDGVENDDLSGTLKLYLNGELVDETTGVGLLYNHGGDVDIGEVADLTHTDLANTVNFNGVIDEFAHYNSVLSQEQIQNHFETANIRTEVGPVQIVEQPQDATITEGNNVSFSVTAEGARPRSFEWTVGGETIDDAAGSTLELTDVSLDRDQAEVSVRVSNRFSEATSETATLTVERDTTAPEITNAEAVFGASESAILSGVQLTFSEEVTADTAEETSNYSFDPALDVDSATLADDNQTVELTTEVQEGATRYTITVDGVADTASDPNTTSGATVAYISWTTGPGALHRYFYPGVSGADLDTDFYTAPPDRDNPGEVPEGFAPLGEDPGSSSTFVDIFESGRDVADGYHAIMRGWLVPPQSGDYTFYLSSDDVSQLWLSTDEDPANATQIANEPQWNGARNWTGTDRRSASDPENISDPITLNEGEPVYVEAVFAEGGGGDGMEVTWQAPGQEPQENGSPSRITGENLMATVPTSTVAPPWDVSFSTPQNLATLEPGDVEVTVEFSDLGDTVIQNVQFFAGDEMIGEASSSPFSVTWAASTGKQTLRAEVEDELERSTSTSIEVAVGDVAPQVVSSGTFSGQNRIGVVFDSVVTEETATNTDNYSIPGVTITGATLDESGTSVVLETENPVEEGFNLTVEGVQDKFGLSAPTTEVQGTTSPLQHGAVGFDIGMEGGDPLEPGSATHLGDGNYDVVAGGSDIWNEDDAMHFVYEEISGDFDKAVRIQEMTMAGSTWAKSGLMARVNTEPGSRHVMNIITPPTGENIYSMQERVETDASSQRWGGSNDQSEGVPLPNAWLRLKREGQTFTAFRSTDGRNWTQMDQITRDDLEETLLVGMASTSHDNDEGDTIFTQFRSYGDAQVAAPAPELSFSVADGTFTVTWEGPGTLQTAPSVGGPWEDASSDNQDGEATFSIADQAQLFIRLVQ